MGGHLRRRRLQLKIYQSEAARRLGVSTVTLSRWEGDRVYPAWPQQARVIAYLGYDPFVFPELGRPQGNETLGVAFLASSGPFSWGQQLTKRRLELKKTRKECAQELGVDLKTLWGWERDQHKPSPFGRERIRAVLGLDLELTRPRVGS